MKNARIVSIGVFAIFMAGVILEDALLAATTSKSFYYDPQRDKCFENKQQASNLGTGGDGYYEIPNATAGSSSPDGRVTTATFPSQEACEEKHPAVGISLTAPAYRF